MGDAARALLDSLMGDTRNAGKDEVKKRGKDKGDGFKKDSVCKFDLVGFCPENEELFVSTKRCLGQCPKTHYEIHKTEFNAHPDQKKFTAQYKLELLRHLTALIRRCDDFGAKESFKNEERKQKAGDVSASADIKKVNDDISKLYAEAENYASDGQVQWSKDKVAEAEALKAKAVEWEGKLTVPDVCGICGGPKENDAGAEKTSRFSHDAGKIHQGYSLIRKHYAELKAEEDNGELKFVVEGTEEGGEKDRKGSKDRSRSRDGDKKGRGNGESEKDGRRRDGDRDRAKDSRRDNDRGGDGGRDREKDSRRDDRGRRGGDGDEWRRRDDDRGGRRR